METLITPSLVRLHGSFRERANTLNAIGCKRIHVDVTIGMNVPGLFRCEDFSKSERALFDADIDLHVFDFQNNYNDWESKSLPLRKDDCLILHLFPYMDQDVITMALDRMIKNGIVTGLALDLEYQKASMLRLVSKVDAIMVMGIEVGGKKQPLHQNTIEILSSFRISAEKQKVPPRVGIDGGVNVETFKTLAKISDFIVIGSLLFDAPDLMSQWLVLNNWLKEVNEFEE